MLVELSKQAVDTTTKGEIGELYVHNRIDNLVTHTRTGV